MASRRAGGGPVAPAAAPSARLAAVTPSLADDLALAHRLADAADVLTAVAFTFSNGRTHDAVLAALRT